MTVRLHSIEQTPRHVPTWHVLMDDLCQPPPQRVAKVLGLSLRSIQRYNATGAAPRVVCLAIFWLTSWGRNAVHTQAHNDAQLMTGYVGALVRQVEALQAQVGYLERIGDFGTANQPGDAKPPKGRPYVSSR